MSRNETRTQLQWTQLIKKRQSATRGVPPGKESLEWVANTVTLIQGRRDGVLVDTFLRMLGLYPDRANPGSLWDAAHAAQRERTGDPLRNAG